MDMYVSRRTIALAFALSFTLTAAFALAQKQVSSADGQIVTSAAPAQAQDEEPELKTAAPSVHAAWAMLTAGSVSWSVWQRADWDKEHALRLQTGYLEGTDESGKPAWPVG